MVSVFHSDGAGFWAYADPSSDLDYGLALKDWLQAGETISSATWSVPSDILLHDAAINAAQFTDKSGVVHPAGTVASAWLKPDASAVVGASYEVTCRFTTTSSPPRIDERSFRLVIKQL